MEVHEGERVSILDIWWGVTQGSCRGACLGDSYPNGDDMEGGIYNVALQFRLLRQAGFNISCGKSPKNYHV